VRRPLIGTFVALIALLAGTVVLAQGVITDIKTPPLHASDTFNLPLAIHPAGQPPWAGWAGARVRIHILDADEMDITGLGPAPGMTGPVLTNPFGPASNNSQSVAKTFTVWHPAAPNSGIDIAPSVNLPLMTVGVHVKNSDPIGNSDVDATFGFWNIWHLRDNSLGSTLLQLHPSAYILVRSSILDVQQLHTVGSLFQFPTEPADPGTGHWLHVNEPVTFHLLPGPGSQYYATFLNTATLGIEHVPEPASALLLAVGMASAVAGMWFRRRRKLAA
jgi:hypothetical protein